jgi:O-antigen/teichoic acid export membrane protein
MLMASGTESGDTKKPGILGRINLGEVLRDGLLVNSMWIVLNALALSGFGFFFWIINARLFSSHQLGLASALIAASELLVTLSLLGFDLAMIRYYPNSPDKREIINSCFTLSGIVAVLVSFVFVLFAQFRIPELSVVWSFRWGTVFIAFVTFYLFFRLQSSVLIAQKRAKYVFFKTILFSVLKLFLPFTLVILGALGIISAWAIGLVASVIIGVVFTKMNPRVHISKKTVKKLFSFSAINYISTFLALAPESLLPLLITSRLGTSDTAYFYISWNISSILFIVPISISRTLLAEDSNQLHINVKKSIKFIAMLLLPSSIIAIVISKYLLLVFGVEYSENAHRLLQVLIVSSIPFAINTVYVCVQNVQHNLKAVLVVHLMLAVCIFGLSSLLLSRGIIYVGVSWLVSHLIMACGLLILVSVNRRG